MVVFSAFQNFSLCFLIAVLKSIVSVQNHFHSSFCPNAVRVCKLERNHIKKSALFLNLTLVTEVLKCKLLAVLT